MDGLRSDHRAQDIDGSLMDMGHHAGDVVRTEPFAAHERLQRVGGRMSVPAGCVPFEGGLLGCPTAAEPVRQAGRIGVAGHAGSHSLLAFEDPRGALEAIARQIGSEQTVGGRSRGMELLGIGSVTQKFPETCRLRTGRADSMVEPGCVQPDQPADRRGCCHCASRAGGVEYLVVRASEEFSHSNAHFIAGDAGSQDFAAGLLLSLRNRQNGRKDHRRRVKDRAVVNVVLFHDMGGRRIDHRCEVGACAPPRRDDGAWAVRRPHGTRKTVDHLDLVRALAGQRRAEPVDHQSLREMNDARRDLFEVEFGNEGAEPGGWPIGGVQAHPLLLPCMPFRPKRPGAGPALRAR